MRKLLISIAAVSVLILSIALPAYAAEERTVTASVNVVEVISMTITDYGDPGINFGTVGPGRESIPDEAQDNNTPAVEVVVGPETTVTSLRLYIKGETPGVLDLSNWKINYENKTTSLSSLPASYEYYDNIGSIPVAYGIWCWVDVPYGTPSDTYNCTYFFKLETPS